MHWVTAVLAWHRANVLGNVVASLEMGAVLLLAGRPVLRRLLARARHHLAAQVDEQLSPLHRRFDEMWAHLIPDPPDNDDDGSSDGSGRG